MQNFHQLYAAAFLTVLLMFGPALPVYGAQDRTIDYRPLQENLTSYLEQQKGTYGIYIIDLNSSATGGVNQLVEFHAASTFKVPLSLYIFRAVDSGSLNPGAQLEFRARHREGGTGRLQSRSLGTRLSIDELVRYSIVYSDNVATNMLLDLAGRGQVQDYMASLGGEVVNHQRSTTCPRDMALYMQEAVRFAETNAWGEKLLGYLRHTVYTDRIPHPLPDVPVANKIGNWPATNTYNDVAHVVHPDRPYILSVFSSHTPGYGEAVRVIREISRLVYAYQSNPSLVAEITLDGNYLPLEDKPFVSRGATMVPLRALVEVIPELSIRWDEEARLITLASSFPGHETEIALEPADETMQIVDGRSYLPLRDLCQKLRLGLEWDGANYRINLFSPAEE